MKMSKAFAACAAVCVLFAASAAEAAAVVAGDTVTCSAGPWDCFPGQASIGSGVEFQYGSEGNFAFLNLDFSNGLLKITPTSGVILSSGTTLSFTDQTNAFSSFVVQSITATNWTADRVSLTNGVLSFDFGGTQFFSNGEIDIALNGGPSSSSDVPEPATWATMIGGLGMIGAALRRRRRRDPAVA